MSVENVCSAILAVRGNSGDEQRRNNAEAFLSSFEASREAWEVANVIIHDLSISSNEADICRCRAMMILYNKIRDDFDQLASTEVPGFMQVLVQYVITLSQTQSQLSKLMITTRKFALLSIAALVLQVNQSGVIRSILQWLNPILTIAPNVVVQFLTYLPEECKNDRVNVADAHRDAFQEQLTESFTDVMGFLESQWDITYANITNNSNSNNNSGGGGGNSENENDFLNQIVICIDKWIEFAYITEEFLINQPIFTKILLNQLNQPTLFVCVSKALEGVFIKYRKGNNLPLLLSSTMPHILALRSTWDQITSYLDNNRNGDNYNEHENICDSLSRLFSYVAEASLPLMIQNNIQSTNFGQNELIGQLLDCCKYSTFPLQFFYQLKQSIVDGRDDYPDVNETPEEYTHFVNLTSLYSPCYAALLDIAIEQSILEKYVNNSLLFTIIDENSQVNLKDIKIDDDDLENRETNWQETIIDCVDVLGAQPCLRHVCTTMQKELAKINDNENSNSGGGVINGNNWKIIESMLYAMNLMVSKIDNNENELMPWLSDAILRMPKLHGMKWAIIDFIGYSARWFAANPTLLPHYLAELSSLLQVETFTIKSSLAIRSVLEKCRMVPSLPVVDMNNLIIAMRRSGTLPLAADNAILEGICSIISSLSQEDGDTSVIESLNVIAGSIVEDLNHALIKKSEDKANGIEFESKKFSAIIDRLTTFLKYLQISNGNFTNFFATLWEPLKQTLSINRDSDNVCEKVCRAYKYTMRTMKKNFQPFLPAMCSHLTEEFCKQPMAAFLYGANICVADFSESDVCDSKGQVIQINESNSNNNILIPMITTMTGSFFQTMNDFEQFDNNPELVEEFFHFMAVIIKYSPKMFLQSQNDINTVYEAGIVGLQVTTREAHRGVITFFDKFVSVIAKPDKRISLSADIMNEYLVKITLIGSSLVTGLMLCLSGELSVGTLGGTRIISDLLIKLRIASNIVSDTLFHEWLQSAVNSMKPIPAKVASDINLVGLYAANEDTIYAKIDSFFWRFQKK